jgi:nucleoside-diphosphate-sugar epimerase
MVFITGVNGLIGSFVAREFLRQGHPVRALRRKQSDLSLVQDIAAQIDWVEGDVFDIPLLTQSIQANDIVIHSAAIVSFAPARKDEMFRTNVEGTANLVNVCLKKGVKKFGFVSSVAALGRTKKELLVTEESKWEESDLNTSYAQTKYLAELEVWRGAAEGLPVVIVNPSVVLGPGDWSRSSTQLFRYAFQERSFYPQGSVNYVDVRDVAEAIFSLISSDIIAEKFILNAGTVSYRELLEQIATRFGKKPPRWQVQPWMAAIAWRMEWLKGLFSGKEPLLTRETARTSQTKYVYQNDKIKQQLGFSFRKLSDTIDWSCTLLKDRIGHE